MYIKSIVRLGAVVEDIVKVNNAIDIYEEYFAAKTADHSSEPPSARTLTVLRDPTGAKRGSQYLSWHPGDTPPEQPPIVMPAGPPSASFRTVQC